MHFSRSLADDVREKPGNGALKGLYQKALAFYQQDAQLRPVPREEAGLQAPLQEDGISREEKEFLQEEIEKLLGQNRIQISAKTLAYIPKRRGALLPLASNLLIFLIVAGAIGLAALLFNRQEASIAGGSAVILTAESKLIAALKQESEQQLLQRDRAIGEIQQRLGQLSQEQEQLRAGIQAALAAKEQQLKEGFEQRLAEERERLAQQGLSSAAIEDRLRDLEAVLRGRYEEQVGEARRQAEAELATREAAARSLADQYQRELAQAQTERTLLQGELERREAELQEQFRERQNRLESDQVRAAEELAALQQQREQERLALDQILSGYDRVNQALQAGNYTAALGGLQSLRDFFNEPGFSSLPAIQSRRSVEMFLIGSLEELVRTRQSRLESDTTALLEASALLASVAERVDRGDALLRSGDLPAARQAYQEALSRIPAVEHGYARLREMSQAEEEARLQKMLLQAEQAAAEARVRQAPRDEVQSALRQANAFYEAGNFQGSLERYRLALSLLLEDEQLSGQLTEQIMNAGYRLRGAEELKELASLKSAEARRAELLARLRELKRQYQAYARLSARPAGLDSPQSLATLLQAKILVRQILDSEPIRSRYPELSQTMDRYFEALGEQKESDGRRIALQELAEQLSSLTARDKAANPAALFGRRRSDEADPMPVLLDRLEDLLR
jgi:hypothetical protein